MSILPGHRRGGAPAPSQWAHVVGGAAAVLLTVTVVMFGLPRGGGGAACGGRGVEVVHAVSRCGPARASPHAAYVVAAVSTAPPAAAAAADGDVAAAAAAWDALLEVCPRPASLPDEALGTVEVLVGHHGPYSVEEWTGIWRGVAGRLALVPGRGASVWVGGGGPGGGAAALRRGDRSLRVATADTSPDFAAHAWAVVGPPSSPSAGGGGGGGASCHLPSRDLRGVPDAMFDGAVLWASLAGATDYLDVFESAREALRVTRCVFGYLCARRHECISARARACGRAGAAGACCWGQCSRPSAPARRCPACSRSAACCGRPGPAPMLESIR